MNRKRVTALVAVFFLIQTIPSASGVEIPAAALNPPLKVAAASETCFPKICEIVCNALFIYKLDALERRSKADIIEHYGVAFSRLIDVRFDLDRIDTGRKGWTRHYPFSVDGNDFIIRIFLTEERTYQPEIEPLFEGTIASPAVTFQIIPGISTLLNDKPVAPHTISSDSEVLRSS